MKMKKLLCIAIAAIMVLALAACGGTNTQTSENGDPSSAPTSDPAASPSSGASAEAQYVVGIAQQMTHDALDAATQGFKDALNEIMGEGVVEFRDGNAGGEQSNCPTIVDGFVAEGVDLILANGTWPLQAAHAATGDIPILGTSITDYATALNIENWTGTVGNNISGTSDLVDLEAQAQIIKELFPDAENVGLLYCSGEPNSVYQIETVRGYLEDMGYTCEVYAFTDVNDLASVTQTACDNSDVIYTPTDNTVAANTETVANVVIPAGVPVIGGDPGICSGCGVATIATDYYELGRLTGELAAQILRGETDISTLPIQYGAMQKLYNSANCEALNITVPDGYTAAEG